MARGKPSTMMVHPVLALGVAVLALAWLPAAAQAAPPSTHIDSTTVGILPSCGSANTPVLGLRTAPGGGVLVTTPCAVHYVQGTTPPTVAATFNLTAAGYRIQSGDNPVTHYNPNGGASTLLVPVVATDTAATPSAPHRNVTLLAVDTSRLKVTASVDTQSAHASGMWVQHNDVVVMDNVHGRLTTVSMTAWRVTSASSVPALVTADGSPLAFRYSMYDWTYLAPQKQPGSQDLVVRTVRQRPDGSWFTGSPTWLPSPSTASTTGVSLVVKCPKGAPPGTDHMYFFVATDVGVLMNIFRQSSNTTGALTAVAQPFVITSKPDRVMFSYALDDIPADDLGIVTTSSTSFIAASVNVVTHSVKMEPQLAGTLPVTLGVDHIAPSTFYLAGTAPTTGPFIQFVNASSWK